MADYDTFTLFMAMWHVRCPCHVSRPRRPQGGVCNTPQIDEKGFATTCSHSIQSDISASFCSVLFCSSSADAGVITTGGTISNPQVLDFESATVGNISSSDALFSNFGISDIGIQNPSFFFDGYGVRTNSSRAVWVNSGGLAIVDPGAANNAIDGDFWFIDFTQPQSVLGFGLHDQSGTLNVEFFSGGASVGSTTVTILTGDLEESTFANTDTFDRVTIDINSTTVAFALDNITLSSATAIPEPNSLVLIAMATAGMFGRGLRNRRRKRRKDVDEPI